MTIMRSPCNTNSSGKGQQNFVAKACAKFVCCQSEWFTNPGMVATKLGYLARSPCRKLGMEQMKGEWGSGRWHQCSTKWICIAMLVSFKLHLKKRNRPSLAPTMLHPQLLYHENGLPQENGLACRFVIWLDCHVTIMWHSQNCSWEPWGQID